MRIIVDADACPKPIKEIVYKAAIRTQIELILVANHFFKVPSSPLIKLLIVGSGFDVADRKIESLVVSSDLVITADIPLADIVVSLGAIALNPRGQLYTHENIKHKLAMRNLLSELRDNNLISGGPPSLNNLDCKKMADQLDRILTQALQKKP